MARMLMWVAAAAAVLVCSPAAWAIITVDQLVRLRGHGVDDVVGYGLVVGLNGTGDSGDLQPLARSMAALLERHAAPLGSLDELASARSIAVVMITARLPEGSVMEGDTFDVRVSALHNAASLRGGTLLPAPLTGPMPTQGAVAFAAGEIVLDGEVETAGRIRMGGRMTETIDKPVLTQRGQIILDIRPQYEAWSTAQLIASQINQAELQLDATTKLASAISTRTVVVNIPEGDLAEPAGFIAEVLRIGFDKSLLRLPARVVINEAAGIITVSGDVTISPAVISHRNLVVRTVTPEPVPTPEAPRVDASTMTVIGTDVSERQRARVLDLLGALQALDVPVADQIAILAQLGEAGLLHGELIYQ